MEASLGWAKAGRRPGWPAQVLSVAWGRRVNAQTGHRPAFMIERASIPGQASGPRQRGNGVGRSKLTITPSSPSCSNRPGGSRHAVPPVRRHGRLPAGPSAPPAPPGPAPAFASKPPTAWSSTPGPWNTPRTSRPGVSVVPKGTPLVGTLPDGAAKGLRFPAKYGFVGMNSFGMPVNIDGINEKGLVAGGLLFPGYALPGVRGRRGRQDHRPVRRDQLAAVPVRHRGRGQEGPGRRRVCQGPAALGGVTSAPCPCTTPSTTPRATASSSSTSAARSRSHDNPSAC